MPGTKDAVPSVRDRTLGPARRLLSRELRPLPRVREDPEIVAALDTAIAEGHVHKIARLDPRRKRLLLEILDERLSRRPVSDPAAWVRVTELLLPSALSAPQVAHIPPGTPR